MAISCTQDNCIYYIEEILKIKFEGSSGEDAQKFIDKYMDMAFQAAAFKTKQLKQLKR